MKIEPFRHLPIVYKERECFLEDDEKYYKKDIPVYFETVIINNQYSSTIDTCFAEGLAFTIPGEVW